VPDPASLSRPVNTPQDRSGRGAGAGRLIHRPPARRRQSGPFPAMVRPLVNDPRGVSMARRKPAWTLSNQLRERIAQDGRSIPALAREAGIDRGAL
jgi:hypothetical protein